jgi:hypothetical protein
MRVLEASQGEATEGIGESFWRSSGRRVVIERGESRAGTFGEGRASAKTLVAREQRAVVIERGD